MSTYNHDPDNATVVESEDKTELKEPPRYRVLLHNDDYTTMDFVIYVLVTVFQHSEEVAYRLMLKVHIEGIALAGVYPYEIAEMKVKKVTELARQHEFPFLCTMEEE